MRAMLLLFFVMMASCTQIEKTKYRSTRKDSSASREVAEKVTIEYTDSGLLKATINAPVMVGVKQVKDPYVEMPKGIKVDFFKPDGQKESYLSAEYGISYNQKKKIMVRRNVEVMNVKGDTLQTEELHWDQNTGRIHTDKFVVIKTKTQTIWGDGMESDQSFNDWEIRNVRGTINKK